MHLRVLPRPLAKNVDNIQNGLGATKGTGRRPPLKVDSSLADDRIVARAALTNNADALDLPQSFAAH